MPSWTLPTLTYHEGIPGHHLQISIAQEAPLPMLRRIQNYSAYAEGWALYTEQLAQEMGVYATDPLGELGYLHDAKTFALLGYYGLDRTWEELAYPGPRLDAPYYQLNRKQS